MTPEERDLRRALDARSGDPSAEFRARLSTSLEAGRPAVRTTPTFALVAATCLVIAMVGVLMLSRLGPGVSHGPPPASSARSQFTPTPAMPTPETGAAIGSVAMFGDKGWATALDSSEQIADVLRTTDGGHTWRAVTPKVGGFIFGFSPIDVGRAWLMVAGPTDTAPVDLWSTKDAGQTWSRTKAPAFVFRGALITFTDGIHGWFAVPGQPSSQYQQQGVVIDRTTDGGKTWQRVAETNFPPVRSTAGAPSMSCGKQDLSFLNASTGWLTGGCTLGITFDVTADGGVTWRTQPLAAPNGGKFATACEGGPCSLSAPRFIEAPIGSDVSLFATLGYMVFHDTGAYPSRSWLYTSRDHGRNWTVHKLPGQETQVVMLTSTTGFASGGVLDSSGVLDTAAPWLYRTDDGGQSWKPIGANIQLPFATLDCVSASRCWALSTSQTDSLTRLFETTDGGRTWSQLAGPSTLSTPGPTPPPASTPGVIEKPPGSIPMPSSAALSAPSANVIWADVAFRYLYRSTDGGSTWEQRPVPAPVQYFPPDISFVSASEGWFGISGQPVGDCTKESIRIWRTTDAGVTWASLGSAGIGDLRCKHGMSFVDPKRGFLAAWDPDHAPVIYRTVDEGRTWTASAPLPDPPGFKTAVGSALQPGLVHAFGATLLVQAWNTSATGGDAVYVFRSADGGATWAYLATTLMQDGNVVFVTSTRWLKLSDPDRSTETIDAGVTWHRYGSDFSQAAPVATVFVFADSRTGYGTVRGGITRTADGGLHWTAIETPGTGATACC